MANALLTVLESDGTTETTVTYLDVGRQAAAASKSLAMSTEDKTVLDAVAASLATMDSPDKGSGTGGSETQRIIIDSAQMGTLGQAAMAASVPVTPASDYVAPVYALPTNMVSGAISTAMTATTSTSLVAAPGASLRNYITTIIVSNSHATVGTDILIQDGSGGTTLLVIPAAAVYGGAVITLPTPLRQPTTNTALYCANVTTGSSTKVSAVGYKAA